MPEKSAMTSQHKEFGNTELTSQNQRCFQNIALGGNCPQQYHNTFTLPLDVFFPQEINHVSSFSNIPEMKSFIKQCHDIFVIPKENWHTFICSACHFMVGSTLEYEGMWEILVENDKNHQKFLYAERIKL